MNQRKRVPNERHLTLVPPLLAMRDLPEDIQSDLKDIMAAIESQVDTKNILGYSLWKDRPQVITLTEQFTRRGHDIDLMDFPERVRLTDEYIDVMFRHYRYKFA